MMYEYKDSLKDFLFVTQRTWEEITQRAQTAWLEPKSLEKKENKKSTHNGSCLLHAKK